MTFRDVLAAQLGGAIPLVTVGRTVHAVDGATYEISLTWLRRRLAGNYHTPNLPRDVRRARALETARLAARSNRVHRLPAETPAPEHTFAVGDGIPNWARPIPKHVLEVRNCDGELWRRPATESEATFEGDGLGQWYDWVHESIADPGVMSGHATEDGLFDYAPLIVTAVAVDTRDARHIA